jgi:PAS domain-containing protein
MITELSHTQILNWQSSIESARTALNRPQPSVSALRDRLGAVAAALESCLDSAERLAGVVIDLRRTVSTERARWAALIERLPTPYVLTTRGGEIVAVNRAGALALNLSVRALVGRNLLLFLDDREAWLQLLSQAASRPGQASRSGKLRPRERLAIPIAVQIFPCETSDGPGLEWSWTDIRAAARPRIEDERAALDGVEGAAAEPPRAGSASAG